MMSVPEDSANYLDQLLQMSRGINPRLLLEWSDIIERKANAECEDKPVPAIEFKGSIDGQGRFVLDPPLPEPDAVVCLLKAINGCLDLMPTSAKEFYAAVMAMVASEAEARDGAL